MTNADKIRSMTDDELAELLLHRIERNGDCPVSVFTKYCKANECNHCWLDWLKQEVSGNGKV